VIALAVAAAMGSKIKLDVEANLEVR